MYILIPNKTDPIRYQKVKTQMKKLGAPVIECYKICDNGYYALEGSHRISCAKELNLVPIPYVIAELDLLEDDIKLDMLIRKSKGLVVEFN